MDQPNWQKTFNRHDSVLEIVKLKIISCLSFSIPANIPWCSEVGMHTNCVSH